jgi:hypothetical protein
MCYIPDPIERLENASERYYYENLQDDGQVLCCQCKKPLPIEQLEQAGQFSPALVCLECANDIIATYTPERQ